MKAYISGPITGHDLDERRFAFAGAARAVAAELECEVVNPMDIGLPKCTEGHVEFDQHTWQCWMKHDLKALLECDAIVMLPGWVESKGATVEYQLADALGYKIIYMDEKGCTSVP